jgi:hypothetical protein
MQILNSTTNSSQAYQFKNFYSGDQIEIGVDCYLFYQTLLPPISMTPNSFYFAEGYSDIIHFWSEIDPSGEQRYFCQSTFMKNRLF